MENKVLQKNLQAVERYNQELANKILTTEYKKSNFAISKTQNDEYNLLFCNIPLHSEINAKEESENIVKNINDLDNKNTLRIVYGLGIGYLVDELSNSTEKSNIILYEPNVDILKFVFEIAEIDAILKPNVYIATDKTELVDLINRLANDNTELSITFLNSYKRLFEIDIMNVFDLAQKTIGEICARKNLEMKNLCALFYTFTNLPKITKNPDIMQLADVYKGKTALIASAGLTLSENIETIKQNQDKAVIFAVNQSAKYLTENGVKPDFIVNIDVNDNLNHFSGINTQEYYFILEGFCHPKVFEMPNRKIFNYISEDTFFNNWFRDCFSIKHNLKSLGTVSISAFLSACVMGFEKIILIGQDLAYKNGRCYAKGSVAEDLKCVLEGDKYVIKPDNEEAFINSMKKENETEEKCKKRLADYIGRLNKNLYTVKGQDGKLLPTQTSYMYFIEYYKQLAEILKAEKPSLKLINSSVGGAQIDGFENIDLKTALSNESVVEKLNFDNIEPNYDKNHAISKMQNLHDELNKIGGYVWKLNQNSVQIMNDLKKENKITKEAEKLIKEHKQLCKTILEYSTNGKDEIVKFVLNKRMENYKKYLDTDFYSDIEKLNEVLNLMIVEKSRAKRFCFYTGLLADCESLILE